MSGEPARVRTQRPAQHPPGWLGWPLLASACVGGALLTAAAALVYGGGGTRSALPGLPDAGQVTPWALPVARVLTDGAAVVTVGLVLTAVALLPAAGPRLAADARWYLRRAAVAGAVWAVLAVVAAVFTVSDIAGRPLGEISETSLLLRFAPSRALLVEAALAAVVAAVAARVRSRNSGVLLLTVAVVAVLPRAFTGHAADVGDHGTAVSSLVFHLVGVTVWAGGLVGLLAYVTRTPGGRHGALPVSATARRQAAYTVARRFSGLALVCWLVVAVSGTVNAWVRLHSVAALVDTAYGRIVLGKLAALLVLGMLGRVHRTQTLDRLARGHRGAFARLAAAEVVIMAVTIGLAVGLSRTPV